MSPTPFPATAPLLGPLTEWCLDTFDGLAPLLIGVEFTADGAGFHPVELDPVDPVADLVGLQADPDWSAAIIIVDVLHSPSERMQDNIDGGLLAFACDRGGASTTRLDYPNGSRRVLRHPRGVLEAVCRALFCD